MHYPEDAIIRVVLDNHSAHISKETMTYLSSRPGRFEYVHTPKHGSWLKGIAEINASPVVFRWNKFDLGVT
jgi:hypothetical protein